jgi:hypothetical protein
VNTFSVFEVSRKTAHGRFATRPRGCRLPSRSASGPVPPAETSARRFRPVRIDQTGRRGSARSARSRERHLGRDPERDVVSQTDGGLRIDRVGRNDAACGCRGNVEAKDTVSIRRNGDRPFVAGARRTCSTLPAPSAAMMYQFSAPMRADMKMIRRPSGLHTGSPSIPGLNVRRLEMARSVSRIQISVSP